MLMVGIALLAPSGIALDSKHTAEGGSPESRRNGYGYSANDLSVHRLH